MVAETVLAKGKLELQAYARAEADLERTDWDWYYDEDTAADVVELLGTFRHSKGEWAGERIVLLPWQRFCTEQIFGWRHKETGYRRFSRAYLSMARKGAKSTYGALIGNKLFLFDNEPGAEVYTAATKLEQARVVHTEAIRMLKQAIRDEPEIASQITIFKSIITSEPNNAKYEPLGADSSRLDGLNPSGAIIDEYHAHLNADVYQVLRTGMGARRQPFILIITTAGFGQTGPCFDLDLHGQRVLDPKATDTDDRLFIFIARLDQGDDWHDEANWPKANPSFPITPKLDYLRERHVEALRGGTDENNFLVKNLNLWTQQAERWISLDAWDECVGDVDPKALLRKACWCGLDLAATSDLTAFVMIFKGYKVMARFWLPEDTVKKREDKRWLSYRDWAKAGWLTITPGAATDYNRVVEDIKALRTAGYPIKEIAVDQNFQGAQVITDLVGEDFEAFAFSQGFGEMSAPCMRLEELVKGHELQHAGNPVLRWMIDNAVKLTDAYGNIRVDRKKSVDKVDGIVALAMALARLMVHEDGTSVYDRRGLLTIG